MTKIEFLMSIDGSEPRPVDVQAVANFAEMILMMRNPAPILPPTGQQEKVAPPTGRLRFLPPSPPIGERSIDYATKAALTFVDVSFSLAELMERMESLGWKTRAETKRNRVNTVRATIRDREDFSNHGDGQWTYKDLQQDSPVPDAQASDAGLFVQT